VGDEWPDAEHGRYRQSRRRALLRAALITGVAVGLTTAALVGLLGGSGAWVIGLVVGCLSGLASWLYLRMKAG
jgi:hypothetical protein